MLPINKIICGDNASVLRTFPNNSIDLTVTSPPYGHLRDYKGFTWDFESLARQLFRVTKDGGVVVWVVGDETKNYCESLLSFKQAIFFVESCGFKLLDTMIYYKSCYAPAYPSLLRYANTFEYMFILSKGRPTTFNPIQAEKKIKKYTDKTSAFRQKDGSLRRVIISCDRETKDAENVWTISPAQQHMAGEHPAIFPEQLVHDHIISWSNANCIVLDPFNGSGTTTKVARQLERRYIGIEISKEYCEIARRRLTWDEDIAKDAEHLSSSDFEDLII